MKSTLWIVALFISAAVWTNAELQQIRSHDDAEVEEPADVSSKVDDPAKSSLISKIASNVSNALSSSPTSNLRQPKSSEVTSAHPVESAGSKITSAPMVKSIPPVRVVPTSATSLPNAILPSSDSDHHVPAPSQTNPRLRTSCDEILKQVEVSTMYRHRNSSVFGAFTMLNEIVKSARAAESQRDHVDDDKNARVALDVIAQTYGPHSLPWDYIASLRNCATNVKGSTLFMRLVELGYLKTLSAPSSDQLNLVRVDELRDTDNNNILHFAVLSKSLPILNHVISRIGADYMLKLLQQQNINGKRPVDIAVDLQLEDVTAKLKDQYSLASSLAKLQSRMNYQSPEVVQLAKNLN